MEHSNTHAIHKSFPASSSKHMTMCSQNTNQGFRYIVWEPRSTREKGNDHFFKICLGAGRHSFRNVPRLWHFAGNSFIVRCHVKSSMYMLSRYMIQWQNRLSLFADDLTSFLKDNLSLVNFLKLIEDY